MCGKKCGYINRSKFQVPFHEIIDGDMDEERNDVVFIEGKVGSNKKMKGAMGLSSGSGSSAQFDSKVTCFLDYFSYFVVR